MKKAGEEGDWKKKTQDRVGWKRLADEAVKKFFFFFVILHSFTIEDFVSAPNLKLGCAVILRGCMCYMIINNYIQTVLVV